MAYQVHKGRVTNLAKQLGDEEVLHTPVPTTMALWNQDAGKYTTVEGETTLYSLLGRLEHPPWSPLAHDPNHGGYMPFTLKLLNEELKRRGSDYKLIEFNGMDAPAYAGCLKRPSAGEVNVRDLMCGEVPEWDTEEAADEPRLYMFVYRRYSTRYEEGDSYRIQFTTTKKAPELWKPSGFLNRSLGHEYIQTLRVSKPGLYYKQAMAVAHAMWHHFGAPDVPNSGWEWTAESDRVALEAWDTTIGESWTEYKAPGT